jgi:hypothetical protein
MKKNTKNDEIVSVEQVHWVGYGWLVVSPNGQEEWYRIYLKDEKLTPQEWDFVQTVRPKVMLPPKIINDENIQEWRKTIKQ